MKYPLVSIIISNFNGTKLSILEESLKHFTKLDYPDYELLLVDNASTDNSVKVAQRIFGKNPKFKIIQNPINMYSEGVNLGFRAAKGEYIALFNNDVVTEKKYIQRLVAAFKRHSKLAIVQGKFMWYFDRSIIDSAGEAMDIYGNPVTIGYRTKDVGEFDKEEEILSASGAACLIKTEALRKVGFYDKNYGIGYEDMDHSLRFRDRGYQIMRVPDAICYHKRGTTDLSPMVRVKVRWHFNKNRLATMIRNYPLSLLVKALPVTFVIYLGNMLWETAVLKNVPLALTRVKAISWTIVNIPYLLTERRKIRKYASEGSDKKTLKLFSKSDLLGKTRAVVLDRLNPLFTKIQYLLPWTYPSQIKKLIKVGSTIVDIGCGDGHLMAWINSKAEYKVVGVDINEEDLDVARDRKCFFASDLTVYKRVIKADITKKIPLKGKFDVVLCSQTVEHLEKKKAMSLINKIEKFARKRVIVATINGFFQFDHRDPGKYDIHLSGWSPQDFENMDYKVLGHGLRIIYKPGNLKDRFPLLNPLFFVISFISTPLIEYTYPLSLLLIAYKNV